MVVKLTKHCSNATVNISIFYKQTSEVKIKDVIEVSVRQECKTYLVLKSQPESQENCVL